jgi:opacity protein-like surface antigen
MYVKEAAMRLNLKLSVLGCALAGVIVSSLPAAADWNKPYIYRESNGSWTNVRYDDGVCKYYYSHNSYDNNTHLNKYGDCSRVAIGPDGIARPIYMVPAPYGAVETYGSGLE